MLADTVPIKQAFHRGMVVGTGAKIMPRKLHNALTAVEVKTAKPGRHADGGGLHLLVKDTGARSGV